MKGISPILGAIFLIVIAVGLLPIISTWFGGIVDLQTSITENQTTQGIECAANTIQIQDVFFDVTDGRGRINVKNSGLTDQRIMSANLYSTNGTPSIELDSYPIDIPKGEFRALEFNITETVPSCAAFSEALVSTQCDASTFTGTPKNC